VYNLSPVGVSNAQIIGAQNKKYGVENPNAHVKKCGTYSGRHMLELLGIEIKVWEMRRKWGAEEFNFGCPHNNSMRIITYNLCRYYGRLSNC
jgi:hypothetical protein